MLKLREFRTEDAPRLQAYLNDPEVTRFLSTRIPQPYTQEDAIWWITEGSKLGIARAIDYNHAIVGVVGADRGLFERSRSAEIGYWIGKPYWGQGIASLALGTLTRHIFQSTDIVRLQAYVFEGNQASIKVLENNGYRLEGMLEKAVFKNQRYYNEYLYALTN